MVAARGRLKPDAEEGRKEGEAVGTEQAEAGAPAVVNRAVGGGGRGK